MGRRARRTCEARAPVAHNRRCGDRHFGDHYRDLALDWFHSPVPVERLTAC